jgi:hypothetical protein
MVARYAQTDLAVDFEAAGGGEEAEGGRSEGILGRQDDATVVDAAVVCRGRGRPAYCEVPLEQVGL